jgi:hypothetical protein
MLSYVSPKARGWKKYFFVDVLMTGSTLGAYSNCLAVPEKNLHLFQLILAWVLSVSIWWLDFSMVSYLHS